MADAAAVMAQVFQVQSLLASLTALDLTGYLFPAASNVADGSSFDFIIVGGGTAGSVLANRLTEDENVNVVLMEVGGDAPLESKLASLFPYQPNSSCDWNLFSQNDNYTSQYHKNKVAALTQGKMLGGTSSLDHLIYYKGNPQDYKWWADAVGDDSWGWDGVSKYLKKTEKLVDNTLDNQLYGRNGYLGLEQQLHPEQLNNIMAAMADLGNKVVKDTNANGMLGISEPVYNIVDSVRQSNAIAYLGPIKNRSNLKVLKNTLVTKIIFEGTTATGVQAVTSDRKTVTFNAKKEVIVSAGAFGSPKLLMLSGIGPKQHLETLGIKVISDLAGVGQNLHDHYSVPIVHTLDKSDAPAPPAADPGLFPVPLISGFRALDSAQTYPDYQTLSLFLPHDTVSTLALCSNVFTYVDAVCNAIYNASKGKNILWTVHNILHPTSRGSVQLRSANPTDGIIINHGMYSDKNDLVREAAYAADFARLVNTTYFKSLGSELVQFDLPECANLALYSDEWWQCYTLQLSSTLFTYSGTCSMGTVVDARLKVKGVSKLRVVDASAMPNVISGQIKSAVLAIAEKGSDLIKEDNGISVAITEISSAGKISSVKNVILGLEKMVQGWGKHLG